MDFATRIIAAAIALWIMAFSANAAGAPEFSAHAVFMIGEPEYDTETTLKAFAKAELEPRGIRCTFVLVAEKSESFPGIAVLKTADLLLISVRRHSPPPEEMAVIRSYIAANKPLIGIRTASHAFGKRSGEKEGAWERFDQEVLGGNYSGHYGVGVASLIRANPEAITHPILDGVTAEEFRSASHLYRNRGISPWVTTLLFGRMLERPEVEPVAWCADSPRRMFYTSLGSQGDFALPQFRRLLLNAVYWALQIPPADATVRPSQVPDLPLVGP